MSGCVSVGVTRSKAAGSTRPDGSLKVTVYDTPSQERAGIASTSGVSTEFLRFNKGRDSSVEKSSSATWSVDGLEPGGYRLRLRPATATSAAAGGARTASVKDTDFKIRSGEDVRADVILKKFPTLTVVGVTVGVAVGVAAIVAYNRSTFHLEGSHLGHRNTNYRSRPRFSSIAVTF